LAGRDQSHMQAYEASYGRTSRCLRKCRGIMPVNVWRGSASEHKYSLSVVLCWYGGSPNNEFQRDRLSRVPNHVSTLRPDRPRGDCNVAGWRACNRGSHVAINPITPDQLSGADSSALYLIIVSSTSWRTQFGPFFSFPHGTLHFSRALIGDFTSIPDSQGCLDVYSRPP
jgi:hypothetical protein